MHLIIDGYGEDASIMQNQDLIYEILDRCPPQIGMTKISPPHVFRYVGTKPEDWGISGFVLIAESHMSIHTFVERCFVNIDIFSCKEFDAEKVTRDLQHKLHLTRLRSYVLKRGLEYPDHVEQEAEIVSLEPAQALKPSGDGEHG